MAAEDEAKQSATQSQRTGSWFEVARRKAISAIARKWSDNPASTRRAGEILTGPIIGKVTDSTARILVEVDNAAHVTVKLTPVPEPMAAPVRSVSRLISRKEEVRAGGRRVESGRANLGSPVSKVQNLHGGRPEVFCIEGLQPSTRYEVEFDGIKNVIPCSFRTFPKDADGSGVNVGVISCNKIFVTQQEIPIRSDLWAHLERTIKTGTIDQLVHLGDQVYADGDKIIDADIEETKFDQWSDRFRSAEALLKNVPQSEWKNKEQVILEKYRGVYRETWRHGPTAACLANCPNLMIYDDHEVRDNWGDDKQDSDVNSLHFFIARCAWIVNLEYQRQLHENVDFERLGSIHKDYHFHVIGGVGYMFLDIRGSRSFHRQIGDPKPYLGSRQWEDVERCMSPGGLFHNVRALLICSPAPLVFLDPGFTNVLGNAVQRLEDFKGHWSAPEHIKEQIEFCNTIWKWKSSGKGREVLVLGGDVHCGGHSRILKDNKVLFSQLTTSAIANRPLPKSAYYLLRAAGRLEGLQQGYSFNHHRWTRSRNYGVVEITNHRLQDKGITKIASQLFIGKLVTGVKTGDKVLNTNVEIQGCCGGICV